jgi:hypothetical protein
MASWGTQSSSDSDVRSQPAPSLEQTAHDLSQARRRLLGAAVVLLLACALIPWMLDSTPRAWGDDVILKMPKGEQPYQLKVEKSEKPVTSPATLNPAKPSAAEIKP